MTGTAGVAQGVEGDSVEGYSVLIVDDHPSFRSAARLLLEHEVETLSRQCCRVVSLQYAPSGRLRDDVR